MRIVLIADIHANIVALEAVWLAIREESPDFVICLGDVLNIGPRPLEVLRLLQAEPAWILLKGNHELALLNSPRVDLTVTEGERQHHAWTRSQLSAQDLLFLERWPLDWNQKVASQTCWFTHFPWKFSSRWNWNSKVWPPPYASLNEIFAESTADVVAFGHLHKAFFQSGQRTYINPGSVGCPGSTNLAFYAILDIEPHDTSVHLRSVEYNRQSVVHDIQARKIPEAEHVLEYFFNERMG